MNRKIYALRHCKTLFNEKNIISGQTDCPLVDYSVDYSILSKTWAPDSFILISSPLSRCVLTSEIFQSQSGFQISSSIDSRIIERNMGILEGMRRDNLSKEHQDYFLNGHFKDFMTPPMGESYNDFKFRIMSFAFSLEKLFSEYNIIICSHNQTLRMLTAIMNNKDYEDIPKYPNGVLKELLY